FMDNGWSLKKLHREIMLSRVYRQRSDDRPEAARLDPDIRLLWKVNRQRLDFESLRDALLAGAGRLDNRPGGPPGGPADAPFSPPRWVYGFIDRQNLPGLFRTFDFASPDAHTPQRHTTTVPQQALFLMNSPFLIEQARHLVARPDVAGRADPGQRIARLYPPLSRRAPQPGGAALGGRLVGTAGGQGRGAWGQGPPALVPAPRFP